ncbi:MAG: ABC transporter permease [Mycobacteriales bacterium]
MIRYIIRRLIGAVLVLVVLSIATFVLFFLIPTNVAALYAGRTSSAATQAATAEKLGLNKPAYVQYELYVRGILFGRKFSEGPGQYDNCPAPCLGYSFKTHQPVTTIIKEDLPVDVSLAVGAGTIWLVSGLAVGILSALRRGAIFDRAAMATALAGVSLPIYFTGLVLLAVFSYKLGIFPLVHYVGFTSNPVSWAENLVLPWIALAFLYAALYARLTRASMLETMTEDYVRTARAKGLTERRVISKHALRAALTPIVTIFGLDIGGLLGGAILTEYTFSLPGLGKQAVDAIFEQDLPVIIGVVLVAGFFVVIANLVVDILYGFVDPRVRFE